MNKYGIAYYGDLVGFAQEAHLCFFLVGMEAAETPLWFEVWDYFREDTEFPFFVIGVILLSGLIGPFQAEYVNGAAVAAAGQPLGVDVEGKRVYCGILASSSEFLDALGGDNVEYSDNCAFLWGCCQFPAIRTELQSIYRWFMGLKASFLFLLNADLNCSYLFSWISQN